VDFPSREYFYKRRIIKPNQKAQDTELGRELWAHSENMIKAIVDIPTGRLPLEPVGAALVQDQDADRAKH